MTSNPFAARTVAVTGATSGLGLALARKLTDAGVNVVLIGRSPTNVATVLASISSDWVTAVCGDLSTREGVRAVARQVCKRAPISALIHNAGAAFPIYGETVDGVERSVALNHQAPFMLTELIREYLAPQAHVVFVTSRTASLVSVDPARPDVTGSSLEADYSQLLAYGTSKLLALLATRSLARRSSEELKVYLVDPGGIQTQFADKAGDPAFSAMTKEHWHDMVSASQAADDLLAVMSRPDLEYGAVYYKGKPSDLIAPNETTEDLVSDLTASAVFPQGSGSADERDIA